MIVAQHKRTGLFLYSMGRTQKLVPLDKARVYQSEQGAKKSASFGSPSRNPGLVAEFNYLPLDIALKEESK